MPSEEQLKDTHFSKQDEKKILAGCLGCSGIGCLPPFASVILFALAYWL